MACIVVSVVSFYAGQHSVMPRVVHHVLQVPVIVKTPALLPEVDVAELQVPLGPAQNITGEGAPIPFKVPKSQPPAPPRETALLPEDRGSLEEKPQPHWMEFAVPYKREEGKAQVALIIDDMGMDRKHSWHALALEAQMTYSFLPYAPRIGDMAAEARAKGHEVMLHLPMQGGPAGDPGPNALLLDLDPVESQRRLMLNLDSFSGYIAVNNHMGSHYTDYRDKMLPVLEEIKKRDLIFIDSLTTGKSVAYETATELGMTALRRDIFLDDDEDIEAIRKQFIELEKFAAHHGHAIAIGHPREHTLMVLEEWLKTLPDKPIQLVPISAIALEKQAKMAASRKN
jgi:polysaccharide deacetylase 2 family uncharacterized protein YibQ